MHLQCFSVYDSKAKLFINPFYSQTIGTAMREFTQAANQEGHQFQIHGGDYALFHLGSFDQAAGTFDMLAVPTNLGLAVTLVQELSPIQPLGVIAGGE